MALPSILSQIYSTLLLLAIISLTIWLSLSKILSVYSTYVPGLSLQEEKKNLFLILRKNFRGITFFASSETPISVIKISVVIHCILKLTFFVQIWTGFLTNNLLLLQNVVFRTKNLFNPMLDRFLSHNYKI
jgi:hypothetical protein